MVIRKVNEDIDIPLVSESREERIIEKFVDRIMPKVEPSMRAIMPEVYVRWVNVWLSVAVYVSISAHQVSATVRM